MTTQSDRNLLLLAVGIVEWDGALKHIDAMLEAGIPPNYPHLRSTIDAELRHLANQWPHVTSVTRTVDDVIEEARQYITKHQDLLDEIEGD